MKKAISAAVIGLVMTAGGVASADTVKVAGSGGMIPLVNELAKGYMKKNPGTTVEVNQKSLGKEGGVLALSKGAIDVGMLASLEAKDKSAPIVPTEIAQVPGLFAVNPSVTVKGLTAQQVCDIYAGKITNWKQVGGNDASIVVLTRPENESTKIAVRQGLHCFASLKEAPTVIMIEKSQEMNATIPKTPNAIGMINSVALEDAKGSMRALLLDGKDVAKSATSWPIMHHFYLATGKTPSEGSTKFIQWVKSANGQKIIRQEKAYPVH